MSEQQHLELILGKHVYFSNPVMEIFPRLRDHSAVARNPFFAEASFFFTSLSLPLTWVNVRGLAEPHEGSADTCGIFCEWFREDLAQHKFQRHVSGPSALVNNGNVSSKASPTLLNQAFSCSRAILDANQAADFLSIVYMMFYAMLCNKRKKNRLLLLQI